MMILRRLAVYGKEGIRELARNLGKSPSTIAFRIKRLEREGIIRGYTTVIDYRRLGYQINAITLLQVDGAYIEELEEILTKEPNVKAVYDVTGEYDIAIITSFREVEDLDKFIKRIIKIPHVKRSMTSIIFRVVKETPHVEEFLR
ncbi:MAG: Lrp/AsnC family transcriptional regulator [Desulfurococcales archaeon]|nr:Lrp/AsnC family transcriptional regulator [Desulfurococcales archaeon]